MSITTNIDGLNADLKTVGIATEIDGLNLNLVTEADRFTDVVASLNGSGELVVTFTDSADPLPEGYAVRLYDDSELTNLLTRKVTESGSINLGTQSAGTYWFTITAGVSETVDPAPQPEPIQDTEAGDIAWANQFYAATGGDNWIDNTGWNGGNLTSLPVGDLNVAPVGLRIEEINGENRITHIKFNGNFNMSDWGSLANEPGEPGVSGGNNLVGQINQLPWTSLGECRYINLKQNTENDALRGTFLTGLVPQSIFEMRSLEWLALGGQWGEIDFRDSAWNENNHTGNPVYGTKQWGEGNEFTGPLPEVSNPSPNLKMVELRRQRLTGTLPVSWSAFPMEGFFMNDQKGNSPLGGGIPVEYTAWGATLRHFHIDTRSNSVVLNDPTKGFTGEFPVELKPAWTELRHFRCRDQNFTGPFPVLDTHDLRVFTASNNHFTGGFPIGYFQGKNAWLNNFMIGLNNLAGDLPGDSEFVPPNRDGVTYSNYNSMSKFNLDGNNFTGSVPNWMQTMTGHQVFMLNDNNLNGGFPGLLLDRSQIKTIYLGGNDFTGQLPVKSWVSRRMITVYIYNTELTGPIPEEWSALANQNENAGLLYFVLSGNNLSGPVPSWLENIQTGTVNRIQIQNNRYTYRDLMPNYTAVASQTGMYTVSPQKSFTFDEVVQFVSNDTKEFNLGAYDYPGNSYQWYEDGVAIAGETSFSLTLSGLEQADNGKEYHCRVTNSGFSQLPESLSGIFRLQFEEFIQ